MGQILAFLWAKGWFLFGPFFFWVFLQTIPSYGKLWKNDKDRKRWIGDLLQNNWKARYRRIMRRILDRIDQTLSSHELKAQAGPASIAFSHGLINLAMLLAIAYPVLGFIGQWIFGSPLQLGNTLIAPAGSATARVFVVIWFSVSSFLFLLRNNVKTRLPLPLHLLLLAGLIAIGGSFILIGNQIGVPKTFLFALVAVSVLAFTSVFPFAVIDAFVVALVDQLQGRASGD